MKRLACLLLLASCSPAVETTIPHIVDTTSTTERVNALPDFKPAPEPSVVRSAPRKPSRGTPRTRPPVSEAQGDVWHKLRLCESGGNYAAVSRSGKYFGAYQFSLPTWRSVGGVGNPANATPAEQDLRAQMLAVRSNPYTQWPLCWKRAVGG